MQNKNAHHFPYVEWIKKKGKKITIRMIKPLVDLKMENQERTNATSGKDVFLKNVWFKVFSIHYIVTHEMVNRFVFSSEY